MPPLTPTPPSNPKPAPASLTEEKALGGETPAAEQKSRREGQFSLTQILDQIEQRVNAATPGPWNILNRTGGSSQALAPKINMVNPPVGGGFVAQLGFPPLSNRERNGTFIAASRTDVPGLVKALRIACAALFGPNPYYTHIVRNEITSLLLSADDGREKEKEKDLGGNPRRDS